MWGKLLINNLKKSNFTGQHISQYLQKIKIILDCLLTGRNHELFHILSEGSFDNQCGPGLM